MATYLRGGQRRTIEAACGWKRIGHPTEVNKMFLIHKRYCNDCKNNNITELPAFNSEGGLMNGWDGINNKGKNPEEKHTTAIINGVTQTLHYKRNEDVYDIVNNEKFISVLTEEEKKPLSKSQKKRQKQKTKKQKDLCSSCGEIPVTNNGNCFDDWCERCDAFASGWATAEISKEKDLQGVMDFLNERVKDGDKVIFAPLNL